MCGIIKNYKKDTSGNNILDESGNTIVENEVKVVKETPLSLNYQNLFCYNIKATQELIRKVEQLEQEIQLLKNK